MIELPGDPRKSIYFASPYSHAEKNTELTRHRQVCKVAGEMMRRGKVVFCPIAHTHEISLICQLSGAWDQNEIWPNQDLHWVEQCDEFGVLMLDGWKESVGVEAELVHARILGKPVFKVEPQEWLLL